MASLQSDLDWHLSRPLSDRESPSPIAALDVTQFSHASVLGLGGHMRSFDLRIMAGAVLLSIVAVLCLLPRRSSAKVANPVKSPAARVIEVKFPGAGFMTTPDANGVFPGFGFADKYRLRISSTSPDELLFRAVRKQVDHGLSNDIFAVALGAQTRIRKATDQEWNSSPDASSVHLPVFSFTGITPPSNLLPYAGKEFTSSGPAIRSAVKSPDGKWLAILSETTVDQDKSPRGRVIPFVTGDGSRPREGDFFLDIYNVGSGQKMASGSSHYTPQNVARLDIYESLWVDNRYFIASLDFRLNTCFIATISR
jgi:hypothetical protein